MMKEPLTEGGGTVSVPDHVPLIVPWNGFRDEVVTVTVAVVAVVMVAVVVKVVVEVVVTVLVAGACSIVAVTVVSGPATVTVAAWAHPAISRTVISNKASAGQENILVILQLHCT